MMRFEWISRGVQDVDIIGLLLMGTVVEKKVLQCMR
jgi:hypothetical protein